MYWASEVHYSKTVVTKARLGGGEDPTKATAHKAEGASVPQSALGLGFASLVHSQKRHILAASCGFYRPAASCQQVAAGLLTSSTCSKPVEIRIAGS
jgi:hypothetical protein